MSDFLINLLSNNYSLLMELIFMLFVITFCLCLDKIIYLLKGIDRKIWIALILIVLMGFAIRMWVVPHMHHVYFDEFEHMNIAENITYQGKFVVTQKGTDKFCELYSFPFWPPTYHFILASVFSIFGNYESVAYNVSVATGSVSIIIMFLVSYLLFNNQNIALCSAFLFNLIPVHLKYSGASGLEVNSLFFTLLTIFSALLYSKSSSIKSLLFLICVLVLTIYARVENVILLLLIPLFIFLLARQGKYEIKTIYRHTFLSLLILCLLTAFYFFQLYLGLFVALPPGWNEIWLKRIANLNINLIDNLTFWFSRFNPCSFTILAIFGLWQLIKKDKKIVLFFLFWFGAFLVLYSTYHIGNFLKAPDSDRYSLQLYISLILFAGFGLFEFIRLFKSKKIITIFIFTYLFLTIFSPLRAGINRTLIRDVYKEHQFVLSSGEMIPDDIYVICYNPRVIISTIHRLAITPSAFLNMSELPEKAILFKDYWWYQNNIDSSKINNSLSKVYDFKVINQVRISDEQSYSFIFLTKITRTDIDY